MTWLVTGGAGYIGGHVVRALLAGGDSVVVVDDLSAGDPTRIGAVPLVVGSILDADLLASTMRQHQVRGVLHLAGVKRVDESVRRPLEYYHQNVTGLATLLASMESVGVDRLVLSSSASVYGVPAIGPVPEETPLRPVSPYGETKVVCEWLIRAQARAVGLRYVALRYFNVAGAAEPLLGDRVATNLIPLALAAVAAGRPPVIFGADYPTPDGTCVRDFVHVEDIADAHVAVLPLLAAPDCGHTLNVGTGRGCSVREVLDTVAEVTGSRLTPAVAERRAGDPPNVVASVERIAALLGWRSRRDLRSMVDSAWLARTHLAGTRS